MLRARASTYIVEAEIPCYGQVDGVYSRILLQARRRKGASDDTIAAVPRSYCNL